MSRPISRWTGALGLAAIAVTVMAHADARRSEPAHATLVSTRSAAWRVLPELAEQSVHGATIELWPAMGAPVRLVPQPGGHQLWVGEAVLGPADPEATEGLWDSLRMATTVRAADDQSDAGLGRGGRIVVILPGDAGTRTVRLGQPTADRAGRFGVIEGGAPGTAGLWVLEPELALLVQQAPEAWLARRAVVIEANEVVALDQGDLRVERGADRQWRAHRAEDGAVLLDRAAVESRIERLVSAHLDPLVEPRPDSEGRAWITLEGADGVDRTLHDHGPCPGRPERVLVDRGPGRWGCVDATLVHPWPVPGRAVDDPGALLNPHLAPYDYGRVVRVQQSRPLARRLARYGGGWRIETTVDGQTAQYDVDESEVYGWYQALHTAEVSLDLTADPPVSGPPAVELEWVTDSTVTGRLRCWGEPVARCRRDDGPWLTVRDAALRIAFGPQTFAARRLLTLPSEDVRAIEIRPGDASVVRQSVHVDLGVWRLDAPLHPQGDAALDSMRLEALLATLGGLRADAWVEDEPPAGAPLRRLWIERVPRRGQSPGLELELWPDCVVRVPEHPFARLEPGACQTLAQDLLVPTPLNEAIDRARGLELRIDGQPMTRLQRQREGWVTDQGTAATRAQPWLQTMATREASALVAGAPPGPVVWTLRILPSQGTAFAMEGGEQWARFVRQPWYYRWAKSPNRRSTG